MNSTISIGSLTLFKSASDLAPFETEELVPLDGFEENASVDPCGSLTLHSLRTNSCPTSEKEEHLLRCRLTAFWEGEGL